MVTQGKNTFLMLFREIGNIYRANNFKTTHFKLLNIKVIKGIERSAYVVSSQGVMQLGGIIPVL